MVLRCGVIGLGYWGPNLLRNIVTSAATELVAICDRDPERCKRFARQYSVARAASDAKELFEEPDLDAVFIVTPVATHYPLTLAALRAGKHVFVEKPLAAETKHAEHLVEEAARYKRQLMVDHIFVYTPAVREIRRLIAEETLGTVLYYDSVRINLGLFQHDVNVIWDLAVHDLSIMDFILKEKPTRILATACSVISGQPENMAYLTCLFDSGMIGHCHVNWLAPLKIRRTLVGGTRRMIVYDDLEPDEKIKIYDRGYDVAMDSGELQFGYRLGDMLAPMLSRVEALKSAIEHFAECVASGHTPITDGNCGLRIVRLLEAASQSARQGGAAARV
jgi:predicted dehydrogenase